MSTVTNMSKEQVEKMLTQRAEMAMALDELDKEFEGVFCGTMLDTEHVLHIYQVSVLKEIAKILEVPVAVEEYEDKEKMQPYLGRMWFPFECCGKKWQVFSLYEDESEVVGI